MEEIQDTKHEIRQDIANAIDSMSEKEIEEKNRLIENRLFEFANFLESNISLFYLNNNLEVNTRNIITRCFGYNKIVVLPAFNTDTFQMSLMKVDNLDKDLKAGPRGIPEPNPEICKIVPIERIDIAIIPGVALDEAWHLSVRLSSRCPWNPMTSTWISSSPKKGSYIRYNNAAKQRYFGFRTASRRFRFFG